MRLVIPTLIACAIAYFVCGIPFGMLIARSQGVDVRHTGSGNIGATNVGRSVGAWAAGLTLLLDAGKGWLCTGLATWAFSSFFAEAKSLAPGQPFDWALTCVYAACVLGHVFSPYLGFHGGKGISVGFGAALGPRPAHRLWASRGLPCLCPSHALCLAGQLVCGSLASHLDGRLWLHPHRCPAHGHRGRLRCVGAPREHPQARTPRGEALLLPPR